jgi:DNA-binding transcriptional ArsR family regulator
MERLELLELVAEGPRSVEALAERCGLSIANASQHLQHLRRAGLVVTRRDGKFVLYALSDDAVLAATAAIHKVAERNVAEVSPDPSGGAAGPTIRSCAAPVPQSMLRFAARLAWRKLFQGFEELGPLGPGR